MQANGFLVGVISLMIAATVITQVFIPQIKDANTSAFTAGELAIWSLVTFVAIAGFLYAVGDVFGIF